MSKTSTPPWPLALDAIGFVMYAPSPRCCESVERAAELALAPARHSSLPVLLFVNETATEAIEACLCAIVPGAMAAVPWRRNAARPLPKDCAAKTWRRRMDARCAHSARKPLRAKNLSTSVKYAQDYSRRPKRCCSTPMSTVTAAAAKHSIGHSFLQTSTLTSSCLVDSTAANVTDGIRALRNGTRHVNRWQWT